MENKKVLVKRIDANINDWLAEQKKATDYLQSSGRKDFNQNDILGIATSNFISNQIGECFREFSTDYSRIYFSPIVKNVVSKIEECTAELHFFYIDELERFDNSNVHPEYKINDKLEETPQIQPFIDSFMNSYAFKIDKKDKILEKNDLVLVKILDRQSNLSSNSEYIYNSDGDKDPLLKELDAALEGAKVGSHVEITIDNKEYGVDVLRVRQTQNMPINDENASLIGVPEIKNRDDARKFIVSTVVEQLFNKELHNYALSIYQEFEKQIDISKDEPKELIDSEIHRRIQDFISQFKFNNTQMSEKEIEEIKNEHYDQFKNQTLKAFKMNFIRSWLPRSLKITLEDGEIEKEYRALMSMTTENDRQNMNINPQKIAEVLIDRKVAKHYLQINNPELYAKYNYGKK